MAGRNRAHILQNGGIAVLAGCYRKGMAVLLGVLLALAPLAIAPGYFFYFDVTPKIALIAGGAAVLVWFTSRPAGKHARGFPSSRFAVLLAAQWLTLAAATLFSLSPWVSLGGSNWRRMGLITWTAVLILAWAAAHMDAAARRTMLRWIGGAGLLTALYGIFQYFGLDPFLPARAYHVGEGEWTIVRPPGTLGYVTYFANWLLYAVFAGLALATAEEKRAWRAAGVAAAALGSVAIVLSGTRGAMLGLAAGIAIWVVSRHLPARWWKRVAAGAVIAALAAAVFYYSPAGLKLRGRARWYREDPLGGARLMLWKDALRMSAAHALTGAGPEIFSTEFPRFQSTQLATRYPDFYHESPHNMFLDALTGQGAPGLLVLMGAVALGFQRLRKRGSAEPLAALNGAFLATVIAHQFACFVAVTALFFWVNLAWLMAPAAVPAPAPARKLFRPLRLAGSLALSAALAWFAVGLWAADRALAVTRQALERKAVQEAVAAYRASLQWAPPGFSADLWYSRSMALASRNASELPVRLLAWQQALEAGARATRTSEDRQNAWYSLAMLRASQNDAPGTEKALRAALEASPSWPKPRRALAELARLGAQAAETQK